MHSGNWMEFWLPSAKPLRQHPAFIAMLQRDALVDYWDENGWPDLCSRQGDTITCR